MPKSIYEPVSTACPNCGASLALSRETVCPFCGSRLVVREDARDQIPEEKGTSYSIWHDVSEVVEGPLPNKLQLKMIIAQLHTQSPFLTVKKVEVFPGNYRSTADNEGNICLIFEQTYSPVPQAFHYQIRYEVEIVEKRWPLEDRDGPLPRESLSPEAFIESGDARIVKLSREITHGKVTPMQKALAIYNYVGDHFRFIKCDPADHGALYALSQMGGDCTEFSDLYAALCRAAGIPTRWVEGFTADDKLATTFHDWVENYFPGMGWVTVDPTWGRSSQNRQRYFAVHPITHFPLTRGRVPSAALNLKHYWRADWLYWGTAPKMIGSHKFTVMKSG